MENLSIKLTAMEISQETEGDHKIYLGKLKAADFIKRGAERFAIDLWEREKIGENSYQDTGYQRDTDEKRVTGIVSFITNSSEEQLLPTPILLNSREEIDSKSLGGDIYELEINSKLYVIDGQHRFRAFEKLMEDPTWRREYADYEIPVIILSGFKKEDEIKQFFIVNSKQKKVDTDLAYRFYTKFEPNSSLIPDNHRWVRQAVTIVNTLNEQLPDSVWAGKIGLPNESPEMRITRAINQKSFIGSLKPFFQGRKLVWDLDKYENKGEVVSNAVDLINNFWNIVASIYPNAVKSSKDYSLTKSVGVYTMHFFLLDIMGFVGYNSENHKESAKKVLNEVERKLKLAAEGSFGEDFWRVKQPRSVRESGRYAGSYSSGKGQKDLARMLEIA